MSEPTPGEVSRALDRFRADVHDDFDDLRRDLRDGMSGVLAQIIGRDVYAANERRREEELSSLRQAITAQADALRIQAEATSQERDAWQQWRDRRDANRKWIISAFLLPVGGIVVEIINLYRSAHP